MTTIARIDAFSFRTPIEKPIKVAFGSFRDRPMVIVRLTDSDGLQGFGEVWCNWPAVGAEHRARLAVEIGQSLLGTNYSSPADLWDQMTRNNEILALQTGEIGPISQVIAGLDIALWDLEARRADLPLAHMLSKMPMETVPVYATGINPDGAAEFAAKQYSAGHRSFKLKIGFGTERDLANIAEVREAIGNESRFMVDANQSFSVEEAIAISKAAEPFDLEWFEEPMRVDTQLEKWSKLSKVSPIKLAGGENLRGKDFRTWIKRDTLSYYQPDITKWGGVTGCMHIAQMTLKRGAVYCPHVFGGGLALLASLHVLSAVGGPGILEFDCHPNAGRELIIGELLQVDEGQVALPDAPGLGTIVDLNLLRPYLTWSSVDNGVS